MESYTDTLNRLFPWGCETESELITELVRRVDAHWVETVSMVNGLAQRVNAHAEDIEKLEKGMKQYAKVENARLAAYDDLCTCLEELVERVEKLEERED